MVELSVILPTYNESENIIRLIDAISEELKALDYEIIVVDDDSPDGTWRLVEEHRAVNSNLKLIHRTEERGLTSAINAGLRLSMGKWVSWMDCDFSHPPDLYSQLWRSKPVNEGAVIASRFVDGGRDARHSEFALQRILSLILSRLCRLLTGVRVLDITSGYLIVRRSDLEGIGWLKGDYGEYFIQMCAELQLKEVELIEIPYSFENREFGESKTATTTMGLFLRGFGYLGVLAKVTALMRFGRKFG